MKEQKIPFLVVSQNPYMRGIIKFLLETQLHTDVTELESEEKALSYLKDLKYKPGMIIYDYEPNAYLVEDFVAHLKENIQDVKIVILVDNVRQDSKELLETTEQIILLEEKGLPANIVDEAIKIFEDTPYENNSEYCQLDLRFLSILDGVNKNLFIKIGTKFVKLFDENDNTEVLDMQKYVDKGVKNLYVKRETALWILEQIKKQINLFLRANNFRFILRGANETAEKKFEQKILRINDEVHIDPEFKVVIEQSMEKIKKVLEKEPKVINFLNTLKSHDDLFSYYVHKRNAMALVSCLIAKKLEWSSRLTIDKLIYAASLADITLAIKPHLIKILDKSELDLNKDKLKPDEIKLYLNHPKEGAELIKNYFTSAPPETDMIAYQHQELPDGSGFPVGLKADKIAPLSALFIVVNHMTHYFMHNEDPTIEDYLLKAESKFDYVNFRKVLKALEGIKKI